MLAFIVSSFQFYYPLGNLLVDWITLLLRNFLAILIWYLTFWNIYKYCQIFREYSPDCNPVVEPGGTDFQALCCTPSSARRHSFRKGPASASASGRRRSCRRRCLYSYRVSGPTPKQFNLLHFNSIWTPIILDFDGKRK